MTAGSRASATDGAAAGRDRAATVVTNPPTRSAGGRRRPSWREARLAANLSLRELEERSGINRGELSRIERGIGPRLDQAQSLLAVLGPDPVAAVRGMKVETRTAIDSAFNAGLESAATWLEGRAR